ncbi:hypothetical protein [Chryseolinea sp. H1M3-3]|uniref:hypothetical protein n=1 Tax=Chryseolinea sp. H1M3-3 TaxID=3034144 RepID=UPI0023ED8D45|nr:hypothetical protein [Chryseolinea sp. H1M3-3]
MKRTILRVTFAFLICAILVVPNYACTIFILTDANRTLFFNNEDYSNPATRIWFLPGNKEYYGVAYVGFDNDWAQGGVNTAGLAFDWVAGFQEDYVPGSNLIKARYNPSERMLESCATVSEAIAFYQKYQEPSFSYARIMIADKSGASVIIGARNGQLFFDTSNQSRGFGYGEKVLNKLLSEVPQPTVKSGLPILQACFQQGQYATKYSTVYDLRSGEIFLALPGSQEPEIKISLSSELAKGGHYYNMPDIKQQLSQQPIPLSQGMKRFIWDGYLPISNPDSALDRRFRNFVESSAAGTLKSEDFTPELWNQFSPMLKEIQEESKKLGKIKSFIMLEQKEIIDQRSYLYLIEFENFTVLQRFVLDDKNKLMMIKSEAGKPK